MGIPGTQIAKDVADFILLDEDAHRIHTVAVDSKDGFARNHITSKVKISGVHA